MISDDEYLERLVAGIQSFTTTDTTTAVNWNEKINGRQFDVVVRFELALVRYLVLIEVKNHTRKTEARDIEAFITKARDKQADKIIFVNKAGYQSEALEVARRHGVELFSTSFDAEKSELSTTAPYLLLSKTNGEPVPRPTLSLGERERVNVVATATLVYTDGERHEVPPEPSQMTYYLRRTKCSDGRALLDLIADLPSPDVKHTLSHRIPVKPPLKIVPPDSYFYPAGSIVAIECEIEGAFGRPIEGNVRIDPSAFAPPVIYTNVLTSEKLSLPMHELPLGERRVEQSRFYFMDHPLRYFYCANISGDLVSWRLIESFQDGNLVRVDFRQDMKYARYYIPVVDKRIQKRLHGRLKDLEALSLKERISHGVRDG